MNSITKSERDALAARCARPVPGVWFDYWKADVGTTSLVRFLPDADSDNTMGFVVENLVHGLYLMHRHVRYACLAMYGEQCPLCEEAHRRLQRDSADYDLIRGASLRRQRTYVGQVIIIDSPVSHSRLAPVQLVEINASMFRCINREFRTRDFDVEPYALQGGRNFKIKKTDGDSGPTYEDSEFANHRSHVSQEVIDRISLHRLADFRMPRTHAKDLVAALGIAARPPAPPPQPSPRSHMPPSRAPAFLGNPRTIKLSQAKRAKGYKAF